MGIIYCALNKANGKMYVGQTIGTLEGRRRKHLSEAKLYPKLPFARALNKHGNGVFLWFEIDSADSREELDEKEKMWISRFGTTDSKRGYNVTIGGRTVKLNPEREAMRIASLKKTVYQYSLEGKLLKKWDSAKDAMLAMNDSGGVIPKVARGDKCAKTYKGFVWSYVKLKKVVKPVKRRMGAVLQLGLDGSVIKEWKSTWEAAKSIGGSTKSTCSHIIDACNSRRGRNTAYGFVWKYKSKGDKHE